jgi:hypothetical protein
MQTVMTSNNGYDSILLVDDNNVVLSAWTADKETVDAYLKDGANASEWHTGEWPRGFNPDVDEDSNNPSFSDDLRTIDAYGVEVGRDGQMSDERREFWVR